MPTYTYRCTNPDCLHEFDIFHSLHGSHTQTCPCCDRPMKKLMGTPPHIFRQKRGTMGVLTGGNPDSLVDIS